jgi:hypothetical protein
LLAVAVEQAAPSTWASFGICRVPQMKLSAKTDEVTSVPAPTGKVTPVLAPESTAQLVAILDAWEPNCPDAGRAAQFLRRKSPGRPVVYREGRDRAIEAYELALRTGMSRTSACMHVANSMAMFNTESKPHSIARRISNKLAEMEADPAGQKVLDEIVLSTSRRR